MTDQFLDTKAFSSRSGLSNILITKYLREGRLKGEKKSGKWLIPESELQSPVVTGLLNILKEDPQAAEAPAREYPDLSVAEFSEKTYLTELGVVQWLTQGRLKGRKNDQGQWRVSEANFQDPNVKRLMR